MHSFLRNTAQQLLEKHVNLQHITLVLPNRRAGLFFTQHLGTLIAEPMWMPEVKTIEDLFYQYAGQRPADDLTLIFELYRVYKGIHPAPEEFDKFFFWGEMILKDFNDLDQFMADPKKLYHQLAEFKEFESDQSFLSEEQVKLIQQFWNSFVQQDKMHQEKFLKFWQLLNPLYQAFQASLEVSGLAYSGKLYRKVATGLDSISRPKNHVVFIGFNAFTGTEERLIKHFITHFGAEIYWDVDAYYLQDKNQEAGLFFREYQKDEVFKSTFPAQIPALIGTKKAQIHTYATPLKVNQANLVGTILEKIPKENWEETVVILPDEQLLFPVLHALPEQVDKVNVTMGYPVKNAPVYAFLEAVLEMQRFIKIEEGKVLFYHQTVKNLLSSIYLKSANPDFCKELIKETQEKNQIYIPQESLQRGGDFFELIFRKLESDELFDYLSTLIENLAARLKEEPLQRSYLYQCFKQLTRLREIFAKQEDSLIVNREFFIRLFRQVFREVKLPFEGEPLQGLQIMGVLESRNLDFRRVIICNMNEDSFPPSGKLNSMIPFTIRKAFQLPVQEQNDAIYAYTFYRLLHSAEEVHMIYTTASDQGKAGEKSRYIQQMVVEMGLSQKDEVIYVPIDQKSPDAILIQKEPEVLKLLERYKIGQEGTSKTAFSPSAIGVYLDCQLKFYLQYLAGIKEKEEVSEEINPGVFGNLAHYSMENLYLGFMERKKRDVLERDDFKDLKEKWVFPAIEKAIRSFYHLEDAAETKLNGQLAIARDVLLKYLVGVLEVDEKSAPFRLISLEKGKEYKAQLEINTSEGAQKIALKGIIDRVDEVNGVIRLIDYKSGGDKKEFKDIPSLFDRAYKSRNKAAMQTMFYGLIYQATHPQNTAPLKPAIFNLKEIFEDQFNPYLQFKESRQSPVELLDYRSHQEEYETGLKGVLEELYDSEIPFGQTENLTKCEYCPYKEICGR